MLIDTGTAVTLLRGEVWNLARCHRELSHSDLSVMAANGAELDIIGKASILIEVGSIRVDFPTLIVKELAQECILVLIFSGTTGLLAEANTYRWRRTYAIQLACTPADYLCLPCDYYTCLLGDQVTCSSLQ